MRRTFLPSLLALLLLFPALARAEDAPAAPAAADFDLDAIRARFATLRPRIEAALGAKFKAAPEFALTDTEGMKRILLEEAQKYQSEIEQSPLLGSNGLELVQNMIAPAVAGKLEMKTGTLYIQPAAFRLLAGLDESFAGAGSQDFLDAVLIHESIHAFQRENFDLDAFFGRPKTMETFQCRMCVLEGHAQYITRKVARDLGIEKAVDLLVRMNTAGPPGVDDPVAKSMGDAITAMVGLPYTRGETFVAAVVAKLGYGKGIARIFAEPPETLRQVLHPEEYLDPKEGGVDLHAVLAETRKLFPDEDYNIQVVAAPEPALRAGVAPFAAPEEIDAAMKGFLEAQVLIAMRKGAIPGQNMRSVVLMEFDAVESAQAFVDLEVTVAKKKDELLSDPGGAMQISDSSYGDLANEGLSGVYMEKTVQVGSIATLHSAIVVFREGKNVAEITVLETKAPAREDVIALVRRVRDCLRGVEITAPKKPEKPDISDGPVESPSRPTLIAPDTCDAPGVIAGSASCPGATVRVELRLGSEVMAVDETMDGAENVFEFTVPEELAGQELTLVAIADDGGTTTRTVKPNPR